MIPYTILVSTRIRNNPTVPFSLGSIEINVGNCYHHDAAVGARADWPPRLLQRPVPPQNPLTIQPYNQVHTRRRTGWRRGSLFCLYTDTACSDRSREIADRGHDSLLSSAVSSNSQIPHFHKFAQVCPNHVSLFPNHPAVPVSLPPNTLHAAGTPPLFNSYCLAIGDSVSCCARNTKTK